MKIVITDGQAVNPGDKSWAMLEELGEVEVYGNTTPEELTERVRDAEVVVTNKVVFGAEEMDRAPKLRCIVVTATGYNIIDCAAARERGITVCNAPAYSSDSVAQITMAFLLEYAFHVGEHSRGVHANKWCESPDFMYWDYPLIELVGKTLGIFGFGAIGHRVAKLAQAFGMNVLAYSRRAVPGTTEDGVLLVDKETLFAKSAYLTFHCPLNEESRGILCRETIEKLPQGAVVINTARGGIAVEADVAEALYSGKLAAYCADVIGIEPMVWENPLKGAPNCILTPHLAWATEESRDRLINITIENVRAFAAGKPINVVN